MRPKLPLILLLLAAALGAAAPSPPEPAPRPFVAPRELMALTVLRPPMTLWLVRPVSGAPLLVDIYRSQVLRSGAKAIMTTRYLGRMPRIRLRWETRRSWDPGKRDWFTWSNLANPPR